MEEWYYKREDTEFGPISDAELQALLGREQPGTAIKIRRHPSEEWVSPAPAPPVSLRPPSVPPPLPPLIPTPPPPVVPVKTMTGPTGWLWFSSMLLVVDLIVLGFMEFVFAVYAIFLLAGVTGQPDWFLKCVDALNAGLVWPQVAMFVLLILWQGCAFGSLRRLYGEGRLQHGRGSGFWWITPVANLFMPFHCLRELHWASRKQRHISDSDISAGALTWLILVTTLLNVFATIADKLVTVISSSSSDPTFSDTSTLAHSINMASNTIGLTLSCLLTVFVVRNLIHQIRLYRGWSTAAPAAAHAPHSVQQ